MSAINDDVDSDNWCTARPVARLLGHFDTDPCSNPRSWIDADQRLSLENGDDGLVARWGYSVFANFPYSDPRRWCLRLARHDGVWVALPKLDPTTAWWSTLVSVPGVQWAPFRKRIPFERPDKPPLTANFPSALVWSDGWTPSPALLSLLWPPCRSAPVTRDVNTLTSRAS